MKKKTGLICLAGGNASRFGANKLLQPIDGIPMAEILIRKLTALQLNHENRTCYVVSRYEEILAIARNLGAMAVFSPNSEKGISYTIRAGLEAASDCSAWAFFAADQPFMRLETIEGFLSEMEKKEALLGAVSCGGETGNPTWFDQKWRERLMALEGDQGGKRIIRQEVDKLICFEAAPEELIDLDTRTDFMINHLHLE